MSKLSGSDPQKRIRSGVSLAPDANRKPMGKLTGKGLCQMIMKYNPAMFLKLPHSHES